MKNQFGDVKRECQDCHDASWFHPGIPHLGIKPKETTTTWGKKTKQNNNNYICEDVHRGVSYSGRNKNHKEILQQTQKRKE